MEGITIPMRRGSMDDISQEQDGSQADSDEMPRDSMNSQTAKAIYEREAMIQIDYSSLDDDHKELEMPEDVKKTADSLNKQVADMQNTLQRINAPNLKAMEKSVASWEPCVFHLFPILLLFSVSIELESPIVQLEIAISFLLCTLYEYHADLS